MNWDTIREQLLSPKKSRLQGLDLLQQELSSGQRLDREQIHEFLDVSGDLLRDSNHKICVQTLQILRAVLSAERALLKPLAVGIFHNVVEKLGDVQQTVRQEALTVLVAVFNLLKPEQSVEQMSRYWQHKNWRVRHGLLQVLAETISQLSIDVLAIRNNETLVFKPVLNLAGDPDGTVRDAAIETLEEMYKISGEQLLDVIQEHNLRPAQLQQILSRLSVMEAPPTSQPNSRPATANSAQPSGNPSRLNTTASDDLNFPNDQVKPAITMTSTARRGGFKDGGGVTANGALPECMPIYVGSERELRNELDTIMTQLGANVDWQKRLEAMVKLEGLIKGGAPAFDSFADSLKAFKDPLTVQVNDRRSAISRQACHLLGVLAAALGNRFGVYAVHFLPIVYKVLVITVQVMAEAADLCVHTILAHCHSVRVLPGLLDAISKDRNAKLRQMCSYYLLQVLEDWEPGEYQKQLDGIEACIRSACQDAVSDTRTVGRYAFAAYMAACPDQASAFMRTLDSSTQDKLMQAMQSYDPGNGGMVAKLKQFNTGSAPTPSAAPSRTSSTASRIASQQPALMAAQAEAASHPLLSTRSTSSIDSERGEPQGTEQVSSTAATSASARTQPRPALKSGLASAARRLSGSPGTLDRDNPWTGPRGLSRSGGLMAPATSLPPTTPALSRVAVGPSAASVWAGPQGMSRSGGILSTSLGPVTPMPSRSSRMHKEPATMPPPEQPRTMARDTQAGRRDEEYSPQHTSSIMSSESTQATSRGLVVAVARAVSAVAGAGKTWEAKVDALAHLANALRDCGTASESAELAKELEKVQARLFDGLDESHFKIVLAAMDVLGEALRVVPRLYEPVVDRMLPQLFAKLIDQKEVIRSQARATLQACAQYCRADVLVLALARSLDSSKQPKARLAVLEYFCSTVGEGLTAGMPSVSLHLRQWVARVVPLISDKALELRQTAAAALQHTYTAVDAHAVVAHMTRTSGEDLIAMKRTLLPIAPDLEAQVQSYLMSRSTSMLSHTASIASSRSASITTSPTGPGQGDDALLAAAAAGPYPGRQGLHSGSARAFPGFDTPMSMSALSSRTGSMVLSEIPAAGRKSLGTSPRSPKGPTSTSPRTAANPPWVGGGSSPRTTTSPRTAKPAPRTMSLQSGVERARIAEAEAAALQLLPPDPAEQSRHLSMLAHRLTSKASEGALTLTKLADCARAMKAEAWASTLSQVLPAVLGVLRHPDRVMQELGCIVVREIADNQAELMEGTVLTSTVNALLPVCCHDSDLVARAATQALEHVILAINPLVAVTTLARRLPTSNNSNGGALDDQALAACLRHLQMAALRSPAEGLANLVPDLMPALAHAFEHEHPGVRKAVVVCLADMWCSLGDWLTPHLETLSAKQLKLVTIYVNRAQQQRAATAAELQTLGAQ